MAYLTGSFEFWIETNGIVSHDFKVKVTQEFEVEEGESLSLKASGDPEVTMFAGPMLVGVWYLEDMSGWLKTKVEHQIEMETDWGITRKDMQEAVLEERENEVFASEHAAGVI